MNKLLKIALLSVLVTTSVFSADFQYKKPTLADLRYMADFSTNECVSMKKKSMVNARKNISSQTFKMEQAKGTTVLYDVMKKGDIYIFFNSLKNCKKQMKK